MRGQFSGAALSVMNKVAEGKDRDGNKEFIIFLSIAGGSTGEVRSMLYAAIGQE
jgi:four helix bundle protein